MRITVQDWSRVVTLGASAIITFTLATDAGGSPTRPVVELRADAIGDGLPGVTVRGTDLRAVAGLAVPMRVVGAFSLHVWAVDVEGCADETGMTRTVVVQ
jgi:hypothetical protein